MANLCGHSGFALGIKYSRIYNKYSDTRRVFLVYRDEYELDINVSVLTPVSIILSIQPLTHKCTFCVSHEALLPKPL